MLRITRRDLLSSSIALSASSLMSKVSWGRDAALVNDNSDAVSNASPAAVAPREQLLFDFGWKFTFGNGNDPAKDLGFGFGQSDFSKTGDFKFATAGFDDSAWRTLNLPHDWAVELPFVWDDSGRGDNQLRSHGYKPLGRRYPETSVGWYRRAFDIPTGDKGRRIWIEFDGAFRDALVFVNGCYIGRHDDGYVPFRFDLTDFLNYGSKNYIAARVDASYGEGWFYEGAGIYRHVWLNKMDPLHLGRWESSVRTTISGSSASLALATIVENQGAISENTKVSWRIFDASGRAVASVEAPSQQIHANSSASYNARVQLENPALWSPDQPNLYSAIITVSANGAVRDAERVSFGVRTARFDAQRGFFLNGKSVKIQGTCNHQDHAGVGSALPDRLQYFRVGVLKQMGCNAVRTSHNMPTPEWVEACDRMGMMMMCETRQMSSNPSGMAELEAMIKRYRNSPSIIIWSIGNEERQLEDGPMAQQGARIGASMVRLCHELDPTRVVSSANDRSNRHGVADALDIFGFNYFPQNVEAFHQAYPARPTFGSETGSVEITRGEYNSDPLRHTMTSYDTSHQSAEFWWRFYATREWTAGSFVWTGFDYRGEPTPYGWPSISSQFGIVDTCGFPKDCFYYYKSWWGKDPVLHLFPHWNFEGEEGNEIPVWVYSNVDKVELLVNGKSMGRQDVPYLGHVEWKVRCEPGVIEAHGYKNGKLALTEKRETTGRASTVRLTVDRTEINADGEDLALLTVEALDKEGRAVPVAQNTIFFKIAGEGALIGVGNGNPNCQESDKKPVRSLFNGLAQAILQSTKTAGTIQVTAESPGLAPAHLTITTKQVQPRPWV